ncbi:hypothetical protein BJX64DRAFT_284556 [Aspergillus heterothallicus]
MLELHGDSICLAIPVNIAILLLVFAVPDPVTLDYVFLEIVLKANAGHAWLHTGPNTTINTTIMSFLYTQEVRNALAAFKFTRIEEIIPGLH